MDEQSVDPTVVIVLSVLVLIPLWRVFSRAGLAPALSLLVLVPVLGWAIVGLILALSDWPTLRSLSARS